VAYAADRVLWGVLRGTTEGLISNACDRNMICHLQLLCWVMGPIYEKSTCYVVAPTR
jgi:hypothetical protein